MYSYTNIFQINTFVLIYVRELTIPHLAYLRYVRDLTIPEENKYLSVRELTGIVILNFFKYFFVIWIF